MRLDIPLSAFCLLLTIWSIRVLNTSNYFYIILLINYYNSVTTTLRAIDYLRISVIVIYQVTIHICYINRSITLAMWTWDSDWLKCRFNFLVLLAAVFNSILPLLGLTIILITVVTIVFFFCGLACFVRILFYNQCTTFQASCISFKTACFFLDEFEGFCRNLFPSRTSARGKYRLRK